VKKLEENRIQKINFDKYKTKGVLVGATLNYRELNTKKEELFLKDFKYLTPANAAMVETMDENVGKLLQTLKDLNIDDNTIVVFSLDHGGLSNVVKH
jgi:arylsulfatase A-like enzyme